MFVFVKTPWKFTLQYSFQTLYMVNLLAQTLHKLISIHSDEKLQLNILAKIKNFIFAESLDCVQLNSEIQATVIWVIKPCSLVDGCVS